LILESVHGIRLIWRSPRTNNTLW